MIKITWMGKPVDWIGGRIGEAMVRIHLSNAPKNECHIVSIDDVRIVEAE